MTYLKQSLPRELKYQNSINNQINLVFNSIAHNVCIHNCNSETVFLSSLHNSLTGKANGFFINNAKTTNLSNAMTFFTSNKSTFLLIIKIDYENSDLFFQHDSYLRIVENLKTLISNGNSHYWLIFKDNNIEDVGINVNNSFHFILPKKSISLNSNKNIIRVKIDYIHQKSFKNPFSSLRKFYKRHKEEFDIGKLVVSVFQHDSYLRLVENLKTFISIVNSHYCVIFKYNSPEDAGINVKNTFLFVLLKKSISLNSNKTNIKLKKIKSIRNFSNIQFHL